MLAERKKIPEIHDMFVEAAIQSGEFPDTLLPTQTTHALKDSAGIPIETPYGNLVIRRQASGKQQGLMRFIVKDLPHRIAKQRDERFPLRWRLEWHERQEYLLMELIRRFFDGGEHVGAEDLRGREFGQASLVFARRTKEHRNLEFPGLRQVHTFNDSATRLEKTLIPRQGKEFLVGTRLKFPLFQLNWKQRPGLSSGPIRRQAPLEGIVYRIDLSHSDLLSRGRYSERRWTVTDFLDDHESVAVENMDAYKRGKVPLLNEERDPGLFWHNSAQTLLISLMRYQFVAEPVGENLTIELDPRTLEVISIRQYFASFSMILAIGGAFDLPLLADSIEELFWGRIS